jgi:predicted RNase H-like HicB family nuclease
MKRAIKIVGHQAQDGGWGTHSPQVHGVYGHGDSFADAVADWHAAADLYREQVGHLDFLDGPDATPDATPDAIETELITA